MPWGDWQFWIVTLAGLGALVWLVRMLRPKKKRSVRTRLTVSAPKHPDDGTGSEGRENG